MFLDLDWTQLHADRPPVLLLGGLDLLRPLGFAAIPAIVASPNPHEPTMMSRYCLGCYRLPPMDNRAAMAEALLDAGRQLFDVLGRRVVLFYGNDDYLSLIYEFRDQLSRYFLFLLNEPELAYALLEKPRFELLARDHGLLAPKALTWGDASPNDLRRACGPVLVKPCVKVGWDDSTMHARLFGPQGKARIFENGQAVIDDPLANQFRKHLAFQEFIPGGDAQLWSFHGFSDENSNLLAWFIGHKLRTFPRFTGMSSFLELAHETELEALGRDIVARLQLKGVFKIDFKKDAHDGRFRILEINARFNLWHHMAARNGINLPQIAYDYLVHGIPPTSTSYGTRFRWLCMRLDFRAYLDLRAHGEIGMVSWIASLIRTHKVYHLFSWADPLPWLLAGFNRAQSRARRGLHQAENTVKRWLSTAS
ncbi:MAG TPA: ATP-grasp domain-containing protein [Usitatibacteraceae bacterium]